MYRSYKMPVRRRIRRRIRRVRRNEWLQYIGLALLVVGAGFVVMAALQL